MDDWDVFEQELLKDPATREAYERKRPALEFAISLIGLRTRMGLSQRQLARRAGMTQPEIARLESGNVEPTWETISRVFSSVGASLEVRARDGSGKLVRIPLNVGEPAARKPRAKKAS